MGNTFSKTDSGLLLSMLGLLSSGQADAVRRSFPTSSSTLMSMVGQVDSTDSQAWHFYLTLASATPVQVTCVEVANPSERLNAMGSQSLQYDLVLRGMKADTTYRCMGETLDGSRQYSNTLSVKTAPLPADLEAPILQTHSADASYVLFNYGVQYVQNGSMYVKSNYLVIIDRAGTIRWYYPFNFQPGSCTDVDASYRPDNGGEILFGGCVGYVHIAPTIIGLDKKIRYQAGAHVVSAMEIVGDYNHDAGWASDGESIFTLGHTNYPASTSIPSYKGFIVKHIDPVTDTLLWTWDSTVDGMSAQQSEPLPTPTNADPYHANAVSDQWENGRLYVYVSLRSSSTIIKIDYLTKRIVWQLGVDGDFQLLEADGSPTDDQSRWFSGQHDAKIYGDRIVLYDNGTDRISDGGSAYTRALQLLLVQSENTAQIVGEYSENNWYEPYWGGNDLLENGNALVAMGHCWICDTSHNTSLLEIDPKGNVLWRVNYGSQQVITYRSALIDGDDIFPDLRAH